MKPNRIILIRHGESEGNINRSIYAERPDYSLELSEKGKEQAREAGRHLCIDWRGRCDDVRVATLENPHDLRRDYAEFF